MTYGYWKDVYAERIKRNKSLGDMPPTHLPYKRCAWLRAMDEKYNTNRRSPMHHDNRCVIGK